MLRLSQAAALYTTKINEERSGPMVRPARSALLGNNVNWYVIEKPGKDYFVL